MHIYCDESGGTDPASHSFVVTAVAIDPAAADRIVRRFRKKAGLVGEAHGHGLSPRQRELFFRSVQERGRLVVVAVVQGRGGPAVGASRRRVPEAVVRTRMLVQAVTMVRAAPWPAMASRVAITIDRGRYGKVVLEAERDRLVAALRAAEPAVTFDARYRDSAEVAGLQVADVIGNAVFRSRGPGGGPDVAGRLSEMREEGLLRVEEAEPPDLRPSR